MCYVGWTARSCFTTAQGPIKTLRETGTYDRFKKDFFNIFKPHTVISMFSCSDLCIATHAKKLFL